MPIRKFTYSLTHTAQLSHSEDLWVNSAIALMWREELSRRQSNASSRNLKTSRSAVPQGAPADCLSTSIYANSCVDRARHRQLILEGEGSSKNAAFPTTSKAESASQATRCSDDDAVTQAKGGSSSGIDVNAAVKSQTIGKVPTSDCSSPDGISA